MGTARVWRLYMAGCIVGFDRNVVQLHQILGVKLQADGTSGDVQQSPGTRRTRLTSEGPVVRTHLRPRIFESVSRP